MTEAATPADRAGAGGPAVFFGVEIILRELSADALFAVMLAAMLADVTAGPFLGSTPFLSGFPRGIALQHPQDYLLVALLAAVAGLIGLAFKTVLYRIEDLCDRAWGSRPEWARPAAGGVLLGLLLLAIPQLYGVGYPVMYKAMAGSYLLWFLIVLAAGKMIATSLTIGIGGSGGVFAPCLFIGATSGMAFGEIAHHLLGRAAGQPALYAAVAMGAVFTAAARAPLTSLASVVEMTGDFALTLPVMLAVAIATATSRAISYGTIYTVKLLRRGTDIDRPTPWRALQDLRVADAMHPFAAPLAATADGHGHRTGPAAPSLPGPVTHRRDPQAVFAGESLAQALRQLVIYGRDGLPVLSADGQQVAGWVTNNRVLQAVARQLHAAQSQAAQGQLAAGWAMPDPQAALREPPTPLHGYQIVEITVQEGPAAGQALGTMSWPAGWKPVSVLCNRTMRDPDPEMTLGAGDRIILLARHQPSRGAAGTAPGHATP